MFYVYLKSYDVGNMFQLTEWNNEVKQALLFATKRDEIDIKFVFDNKPVYIQAYVLEEMDYWFDSLRDDMEYIYNDWEIDVAKDAIETLKRVTLTD